MIISFICMTLRFDGKVVMWGEIRRQSLLGVKAWKVHRKPERSFVQWILSTMIGLAGSEIYVTENGLLVTGISRLGTCMQQAVSLANVVYEKQCLRYKAFVILICCIWSSQLMMKRNCYVLSTKAFLRLHHFNFSVLWNLYKSHLFATKQ